MPDLAQLAERVQRDRVRALLTRGNEVLAELVPAPAQHDVRRRKAVRRTRRVPDNSLLRLIGIATGPDDGVRDVAGNHDRYLADAYADRHE
jgi:hypothetical protein